MSSYAFPSSSTFGSLATQPQQSLLPNTNLFGNVNMNLPTPTLATGTFYDPVTGAQHLYMPGVNLPQGATVTPLGLPKDLFYDPPTGFHYQAPGVTIPGGSMLGSGYLIPGGPTGLTGASLFGGKVYGVGQTPGGKNTGATGPQLTYTPYATGNASPFGTGKGAKGKNALAGLIDPKLLKQLTAVPDFSYQPIATPAAISAGKTPGVVGYTPASVPNVKMPAYISAYGGESAILAKAANLFRKSVAGDRKALNQFSKMVQNLPSLAPAALQIALGELNPQAAAARASANQTSNFIRLLGQAAAGIQTGVAHNIAQSYGSSAQALNALAGAVGGTVGGTAAAMQQPSPLAPNVQTTGLPGGLDTTTLPGGAAQALQYGQGTLPAQSLDRQAPLATAADSSLANIMMGGARQQALMALAQGNQNVAAIMAKLPEYQQAALQQLSTERNASLDRQLSLMQQSGQISASERSAIMDMAQTQATAFGQDIGARNQWAFQGWQEAQANARADTTAKNQAAEFTASATNAANQAQASRDLQVKLANADAALKVAIANASGVQAAKIAQYNARQNALKNYFSLLSLEVKATTGTKAKLPSRLDYQAMDKFLVGAANGVYSDTNIKLGIPGAEKVITLRKSAPLPVDQAWNEFDRTFAYVFAPYGPLANQAMFDTFRTVYRNIPNNWTIENIMNNYGPLGTMSNGKVISGPLPKMPSQKAGEAKSKTVYDATAEG